MENVGGIIPIYSRSWPSSSGPGEKWVLDDTLAAKALRGGALVCCYGTVLSRILRVSGEEWCDDTDQ